MPFWCVGCGNRRFGEICKCGERDAERIPPLDGMINLMTDDFDSKEHLILKVLCGSRAYGLNNDDSDYDYHGVFVHPTHRFFEAGVPKPAETSWVEGEKEDQVTWELGHFIKLALTCNPTVLETLVAPVEWSNAWGDSLRKLFPYFLNRKRIYESFIGYANNQLKKMLDNREEEVRTWKFAVAYLRVLLQGIELLNTGKYDPRVKGEWNQCLRDVKGGKVYTKGHVVDMTNSLLSDFKVAYLKSKVQEEPDLESINLFVRKIRIAYI